MQKVTTTHEKARFPKSKKQNVRTKQKMARRGKKPHPDLLSLSNLTLWSRLVKEISHTPFCERPSGLLKRFAGIPSSCHDDSMWQPSEWKKPHLN